MRITTLAPAAPEEADRLFKAYSAAHAIRPNEYDLTMMRVYRAMAKGLAVVDVAAALREVGLDERGRPKLAIVRADARHVFFRARRRGGGVFSSVPYWNIRGGRYHTTAARLVVSDAVIFPERTFTDEQATALTSSDCQALVPAVPPEHRPRRGLTRYHILFDAEWMLEPPVDPFLLRHLFGSLFVVVAQWDLSEVERMVLGMIERQGATR